MKTSPRGSSAPRDHALVALEYRDFRLIWGGQAISQAGSQMQVVAINWHLWELTHDPLALGMIGLARFLPIIFFSLVGGVTADRRDRRRVMMVTQTVLMLVAAGLGLLTTLGVINQYAIYMLGAVGAAALSFDNPARQSLIPNLVPRHHLTNALTLNSIIFQVASILGPFFAGVLIEYSGVGIVYWVNAASFLAVIAALAVMKTPAQEQTGPSEQVHPLESLRQGIHFVAHSQIILSTMLLDFFATFFASANTLMPIFATDVLHVGAVGFGILNASQSIGSVIAAAAVTFIGDIKRKGIVLLASIGVYAAATAVFGFSNIFILSVAALALVGAGDTVSTILRQTIRQLVTPDALRGRMTSINMIFFMGGPQLGEIEAGAAARLLGAPASVVFGGVATFVLVVVTALLAPALRHYRETPHIGAHGPPAVAGANGTSATITERESGVTHAPGAEERGAPSGK
ncbi:MAG: MFS transporter [Rudaea sp.]